MNYASAFFSISYSLGQIALGLLLHPYQTMQSLVEDKVFVWMTLLPTGILGLVTVMWRFILVPTVQLAFSCSSSSFFLCDYLPFFSNWLTFFCIYWQVMLFYLLYRFQKAFGS